jgi:hypothetical protein
MWSQLIAARGNQKSAIIPKLHGDHVVFADLHGVERANCRFIPIGQLFTVVRRRPGVFRV